MKPVPPLVLFDLDDTLFAHRSAVADGILKHLRTIGGFGSIAGAEAVTLWLQLEETHYHSYLAGSLDFEGQRRARARDFAAAHGITLGEAPTGEWFDAYFEHYIAAWALHDDALGALNALRSANPSVRFGIITNGEPAFQQRKLDRVGLTPLMEKVIASGSFGFTKPDPRIFNYACELFGVPSADAVYVGDRLFTDAVGAADAGLTGVWLDRSGAHAASAADADALRASGALRITSLGELAAALTR